MSVTSTAPVNINANGSGAQVKTSVPTHTYKLKIINPSRKGDVVLCHLNGHADKFDSVTAMKMMLMEEFGDNVPGQLDFSVGYYDGSQQAKTWPVAKNDLDTMYKKFPNGGNITLWCDGRSTCVLKRKWDLDSQS